MSRYDAKSILQKVEAFAFSIQPDGGTQHEFVVDENVKNYALPGTYETFQTSILPQLGMHNAVNKISEGSRFPLLKKIYLKLFSPFLNRQAVFNAETLRAFDMMANHTDQMQQRMMEYQEAFNGVWLEMERNVQEKANFKSYVDGLLERDAEKTVIIENLMEELSELHQELIFQSRLISKQSEKIDIIEDDFQLKHKFLRDKLSGLGRESILQSRLISKQSEKIDVLEDGFQLKHDTLKKEVTVHLENQKLKSEKHFNLFQNDLALISNQIELQSQLINKFDNQAEERADSIENEINGQLSELKKNNIRSINHSHQKNLSLELRVRKLSSIIENDRKQYEQSLRSSYSQTFRSITDLSNHVEYLVKKSDQSWVVESFKEMEKRIGKSEAEVRDLDTRIEDAQRYRSMIEDALLEIERSREKGVESSTVDFSKLLRSSEKDLEYWRFQKQFRADDQTLRKRHEKYLAVLGDIFSDANSVRSLDLACGDGVFLELQKEAGWKAQGVDINSIMVDRGNEHGLDIQQADALRYLCSVDKESFNLISAMQFVEHLTPEQLEKLLEDAHYALQSGGVLLIETINPHTLMAHKWFHFDLTHQKMIFPENMKLLAESKGFYQVRHAGINQVEDYARLVESEPLTDNWKKLNELLYGNQDYYLIAIKP